MARIRTGGGKNSSGAPTTAVGGRPGFGRVARGFRQSVRRLSIKDPADGILNADVRGIPLIRVTNPSYTTAFAGSDNDIKFTSMLPGAGGEEISVEFLDPGAVESSPLEVDVDGDLISVTLSTSAGDKAVGTLTSDGTAPADNDTVTIDGHVYTFKTALTPAANEVLIGADAAAALDNLKAAINAGAGSGTLYGAGTVAHATVTATTNTDTTQVVEAKTAGSAGNSLATTESSSHLSWGAATLAGGGANISLDSTATEVVNAINNDAQANSLVSASVKSGDSGAGLVLVLTEHNLVAGSDEMRDALPPSLAPGPSSPAVVNRDQWVEAPISVTGNAVKDRSLNRRLRKR